MNDREHVERSLRQFVALAGGDWCANTELVWALDPPGILHRLAQYLRRWWAR